MSASLIEANTSSVASFYKLVRSFALNTAVWDTATRYQTKPDERYDLTLVSRRVYGRVDEFVTVMAAAGLDSVEQMLPEQLLILPTEAQLTDMKNQAKFNNLDINRDAIAANAIPPEYALLVTRQTIAPTT
ncbi:hypothetical protein [Paraburkholderia domus]|uniref:hypothetical protein n=1 Tax=Paraburkholderia domus TaxID=2793075 RepID=UPI0019115B0A|nr:hypothetical protein [Paraburkholderia domus]MBK5061835.1 hypothetical protein [Burkholderia sp. R-70199]CAE6901387.1 hypothetical protein R70199_03715 [Paraburkholderia domus]